MAGNSKSSNNKDEKMTVQEAGQRGGQETSRTHDEKFYQDIGREGAKAQPVEAKREGGRNSHEGSKDS